MLLTTLMVMVIPLTELKQNVERNFDEYNGALAGVHGLNRDGGGTRGGGDGLGSGEPPPPPSTPPG